MLAPTSTPYPARGAPLRAHQATAIPTEPEHVPLHEARRRRRLSILYVCTAVFTLMLGYAGNNVQGATQDARDYLPILFFGAAMLVTGVGLLIAAVIRGDRWVRIASLLVGYILSGQLIRAITRISEILGSS